MSVGSYKNHMCKHLKAKKNMEKMKQVNKITKFTYRNVELSSNPKSKLILVHYDLVDPNMNEVKKTFSLQVEKLLKLEN
jgi:hypothetical protein